MASIARRRVASRLSSTILRSRHSSILRNNRCWHDVASPGRLGDPNPDASIPSILRYYLRLLHDRPLATTSITATAAAATGDALAQLEAYLGVRTKFDAWIAGNQYTGPTSPPRMQAEAMGAESEQQGKAVERITDSVDRSNDKFKKQNRVTPPQKFKTKPNNAIRCG